MAVVKAFKCAFKSRGEYGPVGLVLKTMNSDKTPESAIALQNLACNDPDIILVEATLTREEVRALMATCDAVVTLHRSEGLGLLVAEAMVLGKPVISTDYSATTALVTPETGWPVDFALVPVAEGAYPFHEGQVWADADLDHAAWQMQAVVRDKDAVQRKTAAARSLIRRDHGIDAVSARQLARLRALDTF